MKDVGSVASVSVTTIAHPSSCKGSSIQHQQLATDTDSNFLGMSATAIAHPGAFRGSGIKRQHLAINFQLHTEESADKVVLQSSRGPSNQQPNSNIRRTTNDHRFMPYILRRKKIGRNSKFKFSRSFKIQCFFFDTRFNGLSDSSFFDYASLKEVSVCLSVRPMLSAHHKIRQSFGLQIFRINDSQNKFIFGH